ncbi:DUF2341 domain-containing protein [Patescibacteria group bacterium]
MLKINKILQKSKKGFNKTLAFVFQKQNKKRKLILLPLGLLIFLTPLAYLITKKPGITKAAWFDDGYLYRKAVTISNAGLDLTDFQIKITLDTATLITAGKMQSDCDDIRVTDVNGNQLDHWIAASGNKGCNQSDTAIWTKATSIPTSGSVVYVYYGNPSSYSASNGEKVFAFFDDFENSLDKWDTSDEANDCTTSISSTTTRTGSNALKMVDDDSATNCPVNITSSARPSAETSYTVHFSARSAATSDYAQNTLLDSADTNITRIVYKRTAQIGYYDGTSYDIQAYTANTWYDYELKADASVDQLDIWIDDVEKVAPANFENNVSDISYLRFVGHTSDTSKTWYYDRVFFRKYAATEPTIGSLGTEEKAPEPLAFWKFDEGYSSTSNDSTSNNNEVNLGTGASTPSWQSEDMCISGKCLMFDGTDDRAQTTSNFTYTVSALTVSAWIKSNTPNVTYSRIISRWVPGFIMAVNTNDALRVYLWDDAEDSINGTTNINNNRWHHIAFTVDTSDGQAYIYVDGKQDASKTTTITTNIALNSIMEFSWDQEFRGFLDEVKIYPYARSEAQIKSDYQRHAGAHGASAVLGTEDTDYLSEGLVGFWKMNQGTGSTAFDYSGNSNNANFSVGASAPTWSTGKFGGDLDFDGDDDGTSIPDSDILSFGNSVNDTPFSVAAWIKMDDASAFYIFGKNAVTPKEYSFYTIGSDYLRLQLYDNDISNWIYNQTTAVLTSYEGEWIHVAATYDGSKSYSGIKLYLNGVNVGSTAGKSGTYVAMHNQTAEAVIGQSEVGGWGNANGEMDEIRTYNRVLSPKEVRDLYNWAPGPMFYWKMDEKTGTTVNNSSGVGDTGTFGTGSSAPSWTNGKFGGGIKFDGTDDYINMGDQDKYTFGDGTSDTAFSISTWINLSDVTNSSIVAKRNSSSIYEYDFRFSSDALRLEIIDDAVANYIFAQTIALTSYENQWTHIAATYDGSSSETGLKIYVNGVDSVIATDSNSYTAMDNSAADLRVGWLGQGVTFAKGTIDDVKIYNYARTQKQIIEDMNAGHPAPGSPVGSSVGWWKFDKGYGSTANDSSFQGNNGTLGTGDSAPSWTNNGKFDKALQFDGANDYVQTDSNAIDRDNGTISLWFNTTDDFSVMQSIFLASTSSTSDGAGAPDSQDDINLIIAKSDDGTCPQQVKFVNQRGTSGDIGTLCSTTQIQASKWYHVVATWNLGVGSTIFTGKIYINGVLEGTSSGTSTDSTTLLDYNNIGKTFSTASPRAFEGIIDEVQVYSATLTEDEVKLVYNQGKATVLGATSTDSSGNADWSSARSYCIPGDSSTCDPPIAEWKLDEKTGATAYDTSGNSYPGSFGTGSSAPTWQSSASCKIGACLNFDGADDYINISGDLGDPTAMTLSFWFKQENINEGPQYLADGRSGGGWWLLQDYVSGSCSDSSGNVCFDERCEIPSTNLSNNTWYHVTITDSATECRIYLNGSLINTGTGENPDIGTNMRIGMHNTTNFHFDGHMDDFKIYNYARTPAQVAWDYNRGGPVGWWKFDECEGTTAYDSSGVGNTGSISIGSSGTQTTVGSCGVGNTAAAWSNGVSGKYNSSLNFDGSDDYVDLGDISILDDSSNASISLWFNTNSLPSTQRILLDKQASVRLQFKSSELQVLFGGDSSWVVQEGEVTIPNAELSTNNWHHIVATFNGTTASIYLNGIFKDSITDTSYDLGNSSNPWTIGDYGLTHGTYNFAGQIDDFQIFNYVLTNAQIKSLYNQSSPVRFGPVSGQP